MIFHAGFWSIVGLAFGVAFSAGIPPYRVGFFAAAFVAALAGGFVASFGLVGGPTDDMGPGCAVAALCVIGSAIGGGLGARAASGGSPWLSLAGSFGAVFALAVIGIALRNVLPSDKAPNK